MDKIAVDRRRSGPGPWTRFVSRVTEWVGARVLKPRFGAATIIFPNGRSRTIGTPGTGEHPVLRLNNFKVIWESMRRGTVGFAASYIRGDYDVDDLTALFRFFLQNRNMFYSANPGMFRRAANDLAFHLSRPNTKEGAKQNISEHYDLGNDFY